MSTLLSLLEVQALDLLSDRLREKRAGLPERAALAANEAEVAALGRAGEDARARRAELEGAERTLGAEVAAIAAKAKEVEDTLYSGAVRVPKELDGLRHELENTKKKQDEAEERELELLEQIEAVVTELAGQAERRDALATAAAELQAAIAAAEGAIDAQIAKHDGEVAMLRAPLPEPVVAAYDQLRAKPKLAGRAAVALRDAMCGGCRVKLPVLENRRVLDAPDDEPVTCTHCKRLLVRP